MFGRVTFSGLEFSKKTVQGTVLLKDLRRNAQLKLTYKFKA